MNQSQGKDDWVEVWERLGRQDTNDPRILNGYGHTEADLSYITSVIIDSLDIKATDRVLEIGAGAGAIRQHMDFCNYSAIDRSNSLVERHRGLFGNNIWLAEAAKLPFKDGSFDKVFSHGVFHYFIDREYAKRAFLEAQRVSKGGPIFISDLPVSSSRTSHLLYARDVFERIPELILTDGLYEPNAKNRFNVLIPRAELITDIVLYFNSDKA